MILRKSIPLPLFYTSIPISTYCKRVSFISPFNMTSNNHHSTTTVHDSNGVNKALNNNAAVMQRGPSAPKARPSQGQLTEEAIARLGPDAIHPTVDIGANLCDRSFDKDRDQVIERAAKAGLDSIILTGTCLRTTQAAETLATTTATALPLYFTAGCHPHNAKHFTPETLESLRTHASHLRCVAIGECGLDFNRNFSPPLIQEEVFAQQIELAEEMQKPLFMHCRDASDRFFAILSQHRKKVAGVLHCFTGNQQELTTALSAGLYIGITGWVCDDRPERGGEALAALLPLIPDDRLLIETDCPYLTPRCITPSKSRPQRNEPALIAFVLQRVAEARGQTAAEVAANTTRNAHTLFGLTH